MKPPRVLELSSGKTFNHAIGRSTIDWLKQDKREGEADQTSCKSLVEFVKVLKCDFPRPIIISRNGIRTSLIVGLNLAPDTPGDLCPVRGRHSSQLVSAIIYSRSNNRLRIRGKSGPIYILQEFEEMSQSAGCGAFNLRADHVHGRLAGCGVGSVLGRPPKRHRSYWRAAGAHQK